MQYSSRDDEQLKYEDSRVTLPDYICFNNCMKVKKLSLFNPN